MSDTNQQMEGTDKVGSLIRRAGLRDPAPEITERRVRANVQQAWAAAIDRRRRRRWRSVAVAAAVVVAAVLIGGRALQSPPMQRLDVAGSVARVTGQLLINGEVADGVDATIHAGDTLSTSPQSRVSLMFADASLRMDHATTVNIVDGGRLRLVQGGVYIDSGGDPNSIPIQVLTALGTATDVGTQFEVRFEADELQVNVREGWVDLSRDDQVVSAQAGEAIVIGGDGEVRKALVDSQDPSWNWAEQLAPEFDIENRSLLEFLTWAARETGRRLSFADDAAERSADREMLRGSVNGLDPDEALEAVRQTIESRYRVENDQIVVGAATN